MKIKIKQPCNNNISISISININININVSQCFTIITINYIILYYIYNTKRITNNNE